MQEMLEELLVEVLSFLEPVDLLHLAAVDARLHRLAGTGPRRDNLYIFF